MKQFVVALWQDRLSAKPTYEITSTKETPQAAAIDGMEAVKFFSWGVIVVLNNTTITSYFDAELHNNKFTFSKTETFARLATSNNPLIEKQQES